MSDTVEEPSVSNQRNEKEKQESESNRNEQQEAEEIGTDQRKDDVVHSHQHDSREQGRKSNDYDDDHCNQERVKLVFTYSPATTDENKILEIFGKHERIGDITFSESAEGEASGELYVPSTQDADGVIAEFHNTSHNDISISVLYPRQLSSRTTTAVEGGTANRYSGMKLFVGHLPKEYGSAQVRELFEPFGQVTDVYVLRHHKSRNSKGCAFVSFQNKDDAQRAIDKLNDRHAFPSVPKPMTVCVANPQGFGHDPSVRRGRSPSHRADFAKRGLRVKKAIEDRDHFRLERGRALRMGAAVIPAFRPRGRSQPRGTDDRGFERRREPEFRPERYWGGRREERRYPERRGRSGERAGSREMHGERAGSRDMHGERAGSRDMHGERAGSREMHGERAGSRDMHLLRVKELPLNCDNATLREVFDYYGETLRAKVNLDHHGRPDGTAVVGFGSYKEANAAYLALTGQSYLMPGASRALQVEHLPAPGFREAKRPRLEEPASPPVDGSAHAPTLRGTRTSHAPEIKLYVAGIPYASTEEDVRDVFSAYGPVADIHIMRDPGGRSKGSGFVAFTVRSHADSAIANLHGSFAMDKARPLRVDFARPKGTGPVGRHRGGFSGGGSWR